MVDLGSWDDFRLWSASWCRPSAVLGSTVDSSPCVSLRSLHIVLHPFPTWRWLGFVFAWGLGMTAENVSYPAPLARQWILVASLSGAEFQTCLTWRCSRVLTATYGAFLTMASVPLATSHCCSTSGTLLRPWAQSSCTLVPLSVLQLVSATPQTLVSMASWRTMPSRLATKFSICAEVSCFYTASGGAWVSPSWLRWLPCVVFLGALHTGTGLGDPPSSGRGSGGADAPNLS